MVGNIVSGDIKHSSDHIATGCFQLESRVQTVQHRNSKDMKRRFGSYWQHTHVEIYPFQKICSDPIMHARVLKSYELMLDFYGMKLKDKATGLCF